MAVLEKWHRQKEIMEVRSQPELPRGWDLSFGRLPSQGELSLVAMAPDLSLALCERGSNQLWVMDLDSEIKPIFVGCPITALCWLSAGEQQQIQQTPTDLS